MLEGNLKCHRCECDTIGTERDDGTYKFPPCGDYRCPMCDGKICAAEFLIPVGTNIGRKSSDPEWGTVFMDQAVSPCPHCGESLWAAYGCGELP